MWMVVWIPMMRLLFWSLLRLKILTLNLVLTSNTTAPGAIHFSLIFKDRGMVSYRKERNSDDT